jgi:hypothetical protein
VEPRFSPLQYDADDGTKATVTILEATKLQRVFTTRGEEKGRAIAEVATDIANGITKDALKRIGDLETRMVAAETGKMNRPSAAQVSAVAAVVTAVGALGGALLTYMRSRRKPGQ